MQAGAINADGWRRTRLRSLDHGSYRSHRHDLNWLPTSFESAERAMPMCGANFSLPPGCDLCVKSDCDSFRTLATAAKLA